MDRSGSLSHRALILNPDSYPSDMASTAFSWLLPLVLLDPYYGLGADPPKTGEEMTRLLNALEGDQPLEGS